MDTLLRQIPKVDDLLRLPALNTLAAETGTSAVTEAVRRTLDRLRADILVGTVTELPSTEALCAQISASCRASRLPSLRGVINATGIVLHTNLGRACLSDRALAAAREVSQGYSTLEYDLTAGERGQRYAHVEPLLCRLTGAEAAMVVNNNAAAVLLILSALTAGGEVITSRGELVEIGGSFRIPEIMEQSGAHLKEVGTTNKTKPSDYRNAYDPEKTGALMKVHTSNYRILGFTQEVTLKEMVDLGKEMNLPVIYDMGSGLMADLTRYGVDEPTVLDAVNDGADVVLFSGDKLLGGPQGGILIGKKEYIDRMKKHPLARAFRVDKMTLAAMEATFFEYLDMENAKKTIPVLQMITVSGEELQNKADRLIEAIKARTDAFTLGSEPCKDQVGGGSAPTVRLNGIAVSIASETVPAERLERLFRRAETPVIVRVAHDKVLLSVRTIKEEEIETAASAVLFAAAQAGVN